VDFTIVPAALLHPAALWQALRLLVSALVDVCSIVEDYT